MFNHKNLWRRLFRLQVFQASLFAQWGCLISSAMLNLFRNNSINFTFETAPPRSSIPDTHIFIPLNKRGYNAQPLNSSIEA